MAPPVPRPAAWEATAGEGPFGAENTLFSPCRQWRYFLRRPWSQQCAEGFAEADLFVREQHRPPIAFCLLNPSTADELKDDPTVARCRRFAVAWGLGDVIVLNAFAFRATDPKNMKAQTDPVGPDNDLVIETTVDWVLQRGGKIVCGWGNHGAHLERSTQLNALFGQKPRFAFPITKVGEPGHPLYLRNDVALQPVIQAP